MIRQRHYATFRNRLDPDNPLSVSLSVPVGSLRHTGRVPAVSVGSPGGDWPNEPSGFTVMTDWGFSDFPSGGWDTLGATIETDATAPLSPSSVCEWFYPEGFAAGSSPGTVWHAGQMSDHYAGYWFKYSNPYSNETTGTKQWYPFGISGSDAADYFVLFSNTGSKMRVAIQVPAAQGGTYWLDANVSNPTVTLGVWHQFEMYFKRATTPSATDGIVRWWLDGVLCGDHTTVMWPTSTFDELRFGPTWGGGIGTVAFDSYWWVDHVRVSKP